MRKLNNYFEPQKDKIMRWGILNRLKKYLKKKGILALTITQATSFLTVFFVLVYQGQGSWKLYSLLAFSFIAVLLLFILLSEKESILAFTLKWQYRLQTENKELLMYHDQLLLENDRLINTLELKEKKLNKYKKILNSENYTRNVHAFQYLKEYREFAGILRRIHKIETDLREELLDIVNRSNKDYDGKEEFVAMRAKAKLELKGILKDIAIYIKRSSIKDSFHVEVSLYDMVKSSKPMAQNYSTHTSILNYDEDELNRTESYLYPIKENSDFLWIYNKVLNSKKDGDFNYFFCRNNLLDEDSYEDSNHEYYNQKDDSMKWYVYRKNENAFILPYKSLISSAIYDVRNNSSDPRKIRGFLSVSSENVDCFTRSDTLVLQVLSLQFNNIFSLIKI